MRKSCSLRCTFSGGPGATLRHAAGGAQIWPSTAFTQAANIIKSFERKRKSQIISHNTPDPHPGPQKKCPHGPQRHPEHRSGPSPIHRVPPNPSRSLGGVRLSKLGIQEFRAQSSELQRQHSQVFGALAVGLRCGMLLLPPINIRAISPQTALDPKSALSPSHIGQPKTSCPAFREMCLTQPHFRVEGLGHAGMYGFEFWAVEAVEFLVGLRVCI